MCVDVWPTCMSWRTRCRTCRAVQMSSSIIYCSFARCVSSSVQGKIHHENPSCGPVRCPITQRERANLMARKNQDPNLDGLWNRLLGPFCKPRRLRAAGGRATSVAVSKLLFAAAHGACSCVLCEGRPFPLSAAAHGACFFVLRARSPFPPFISSSRIV